MKEHAARHVVGEVGEAVAVARAGAFGSKVVVLDARHIEVEDPDGKKTSIQLTPETKYMKDKTVVTAADVTWLEHVIDALNGDLPPLNSFVLPGGGPVTTFLHQARTVCRRAERRVVSLAGAADPIVLIYLNRLSDLLFVMARTVNHRAGMPEIEW